VESNYGLCSETVEDLYSHDSCKDFQNSITVLFDAAQQDVFDTFIAMEVASLHEKLVDFGCESGTSLETLLTKDDIFEKNLETYRNALVELSSYSSVNARAMLANEQKTRPNKNNYLAYLIANNMFHGATALTEPDKDKPKPKSNFS